jgi:hypothetical protein
VRAGGCTVVLDPYIEFEFAAENDILPAVYTPLAPLPAFKPRLLVPPLTDNAPLPDVDEAYIDPDKLPLMLGNPALLLVPEDVLPMMNLLDRLGKLNVVLPLPLP